MYFKDAMNIWELPQMSNDRTDNGCALSAYMIKQNNSLKNTLSCMYCMYSKALIKPRSLKSEQRLQLSVANIFTHCIFVSVF